MKFSIGTAQFGMRYGISNTNGRISADNIKCILDFAKINGINTLDTAISYGESEKVLGLIGVRDWKVISKISVMQIDSNDISNFVIDSVTNSLILLNLDKINGFLLHDASQLTSKQGEEIYSALARLKEERLIEKIGVSIYDPSILDLLIPHFDFDIVQAPLNIFDQRILTSGWADRLRTNNIELHVRSIFLQGLLLMELNNRPKYFERWDKLWTDWNNWLKENELMPLDACVRFINQYKEISRIIIGVNDRNQLAQILQASKMPSLDVPNIFVSTDAQLIEPRNWNK